MSTTVVKLETPEEKEAIYRFRYRVYVEELAMTTDADHERRWLRDEMDDVSVSYAVVADGDVRGSLRVTYLDAVSDLDSLTEKFDLGPALDVFGADAICTTSRFILDPTLRHGKIIYRLMQNAFVDARARGARLNYGDCSPHLLPFYEHLGYRRYTTGYNDTAYGYKIPILMLVGDLENFERVRSPLRRPAAEGPDDVEARAWFEENFAPYLVPETATLLEENVFFELLTERVASDPLHRLSILRGLERSEADAFLSEATLIELGVGDLVIRKDDRDNTLFVLLSGLAEVTSGVEGRPPIFTFGAGDTFGEIGFLTSVPRTANVVAKTDCRVLVLSGDFMERFIKHDPVVGSKVLLNLARELAGRLTLTSDARGTKA